MSCIEFVFRYIKFPQNVFDFAIFKTICSFSTNLIFLAGIKPIFLGGHDHQVMNSSVKGNQALKYKLKILRSAVNVSNLFDILSWNWPKSWFKAKSLTIGRCPWQLPLIGRPNLSVIFISFICTGSTFKTTIMMYLLLLPSTPHLYKNEKILLTNNDTIKFTTA